ncbi:hypothetical protein SAMN05421545_2667, partial [Pontibacter lucknowensis]
VAANPNNARPLIRKSQGPYAFNTPHRNEGEGCKLG